MRISFSFVKSSLLHTSFDRFSRLLFLCVLEYLNPPSSVFFKINPEATSFTLAAYLKLVKKWSSRPLLLRWGFLQHNLWHCVSPVQVQNSWENVDLSATPLSDSRHQFCWGYCQVQHLLSLKESHVGSAYVDVKSWKLLVTNLTLECNIRFWRAVLLRNMIVQIILGVSWEIGSFSAVQGSSWTYFLLLN